MGVFMLASTEVKAQDISPERKQAIDSLGQTE